MRPISSALLGTVVVVLAVGCETTDPDPSAPDAAGAGGAGGAGGVALDCPDHASPLAGACVCDDGYELGEGGTCVARTGGFLFVRGVAGEETLFFHDGTNEVALSAGGGEPYCASKPFCDYPPSTNLSRIMFSDFLTPEQAIFLEGDPLDWSGSAIYSVEVATGVRTLLSEDVAWVHSEEARQGWVYSSARRGTVTYFSLLTEAGMELFRSDGPGQPLVALHTFEVPEGTYPIGSWIHATDAALVWNVETATAPDQPGLHFYHYGWVLDGGDNVRIGPEDVPAALELGDPFIVGGSTIVGVLWDGATADVSTAWRIDTTDFTHQTLLSETNFSPKRLSPDGRWLVTHDLANDFAIEVFDAASGEHAKHLSGPVLDFLPGDPSKVVVKPAGGGLLVLEDVDGPEPTTVLYERPLATFEGFDQPVINFSADGKHLVALVGDLYADLSVDIGIVAIDLETLAVTEIRPAATSEEMLRHMRVGADGNVVFLEPTAGSLDIVAYDLATGIERTLVSSPEHERLFKLGSKLE